MCPVMRNHLSRYIFSGSSLFCLPSTGYVKTLLQFLVQHNHYVKSVQIRSFFCSVFSHIRTEYGEIRSISSYSVRMPENTDQKKLRIYSCLLVLINSFLISCMNNFFFFLPERYITCYQAV